MEETRTEKYISALHGGLFFDEFTYRLNKFVPENQKQELQLGDSVVWLDDLLFLYEIKERDKQHDNEQDAIKWFKNKVLKLATNQIKKSVGYLNTFESIKLPNKQGHIFDLKKAANNYINKVVLYDDNFMLPKQYRFKKFYKSKEVGLIHLFHLEDYSWVSQYLITPAEIAEYLWFREELFERHQKKMDALSEQYVLGHFFETEETDHINPNYEENLKQMNPNTHEFDVSFLIKRFKETQRIMNNTRETDYYQIIKEIAKLNRAELREFKKRFSKTIETVNADEDDWPYRVAYSRTGCGFVFIPLQKKIGQHWKNVLTNYTLAHKYEQNLNKCVGLIVFVPNDDDVMLELFWLYAESEWEYIAEAEKQLKDDFPFREVKLKPFDREYLKKK